MEKHSNKAMITHQRESKYVLNQYGCVIDSLMAACVKIRHLGSLRCEHFGFSIHIEIFRGCKILN